MTSEKELITRSTNKCELCTSTEHLQAFEVSHSPNDDQAIYVCSTCHHQLKHPEQADANHWRCLNDSMWSETPAVQVVAFRMLHHLKTETWPQDLLDMMYLDEHTKTWATAGLETEDKIIHKDSNGAVLSTGDSVVLIKDLNVKGANFTAKRGTAVRRISLVHDNPEHIEGKINGQQIVILTKYVKRSK